jgi:amino acid transporter
MDQMLARPHRIHHHWRAANHGPINFFGPKHSGSFAVALALPTAVIVVVLIAISAPHFTTHFLEPRHQSLGAVWVQFVGVILALSGAESIANLTGVMKLDPGSTMEHPSVARESVKAITPVAIEVVLGTALLGWAMLSLPSVLGKTLHLTDRGEIAAVLGQRSEDMLRFIAEQFATATFSPAVGQVFGWIVGIVFFFLLLSAANTAIVAMIVLLYMMSRDLEMPRQFRRLNRHGVPTYPLQCHWASECGFAFRRKLHGAGRSLRDWGSRGNYGQCGIVRI